MVNKNNIKEFYNDVYRKGDIRDNRRLYSWIVKLLKPFPGAKVLDIGCGVGCLLYEAAKKKAGLFGLDLSEEALKKLKIIIPSAKICVADGEKIAFKDASFDRVASLGSIEHFLSPETGIREVARILKKDGMAILLLPNSFFLGEILKVARTGKSDQQWQIQERLLNREEWRLLIEKNGLKVERVYGYNKYPELFQEGSWKIKSISKFIRAFCMHYFCPLNLSWEFVYVCRKLT
jgi:ubiquinone/menaquinone biosynthesis C-methylase UbiE